MQRTSLSDEELLSQIASLCLEGRRLVARVIVHLIQIEDRALDKKSACSSMWTPHGWSISILAGELVSTGQAATASLRSAS